MLIDELTRIVISKAIKIHEKIGCGCFEIIYEEILYYELCKAGLEVKRQLLFPLLYDDLKFERAYKTDLIVENRLVVEIKTVYPLPPVYFAQVHSHLFLTKLRYGMLLNFKVPLMKEGIHRIFNNKGRDIS